MSDGDFFPLLHVVLINPVVDHDGERRHARIRRGSHRARGVKHFAVALQVDAKFMRTATWQGCTDGRRGAVS